MPNSVKANFAFNLINTVAGLLFPLITFPYASRILLADGIGLVNFFQSIVAYIILLSSIGIPLYAIREIARVRDDARQMNMTAIEILLLHACLTVVAYIVVSILCLTISDIKVDIPLFLVLSTSIFFTAIGCEWFYQGIEDFKYIAMRSLAVKCLYVFLLFSLVKSKDDLMIYGVLTIIGTVGNNIFNFIRLRKYINSSLFHLRELHPFRHFRPASKVFVLNLIISLYVNLNTVMLGFMADVTAVGLFTAASKISHMMLGITGALQNAILPRTSNLMQSGDYKKFEELTQKVMDFIVLITLPLTVGLIIIAPSVITVLCGDSFRSAALSLAILSPIILVISLSGLFGVQMLYPQGKENIVIISTGLGAVVNLILNFFLIPIISYNGASIATLVAEIVVTASMAYLGRKYLPIARFTRHYEDCIIGTVLLSFVCLVICRYIEDDMTLLVISSLLGFVVYCVWLLIRKNVLTLDLIKFTKAKVKTMLL